MSGTVVTRRPRTDRAQPVQARAQHPLWLSVVLHLAPGAALAVFILAVTPVLESRGIDTLFAFVLGIGLVIAPLELGYLAVVARRSAGTWNPLAVVDYRQRLRGRRLAMLAAGLAAWMLVFITASQFLLDTWMAERFFQWLPDAILQMSVVEGGDAISGGMLVVLLAMFFVLNGFVGPIVEELYFRGHLLARIDRYGPGAPVLNAVLFGMYHLWTPWRWPSLIVGFLPMSWMAWRTQSVGVSMAAHVVVNSLFLLMLLASFLAVQ